jgi:hypothetical protein
MMNPKTRSLQQQEELTRTVDSPNPRKLQIIRVHA